MNLRRIARAGNDLHRFVARAVPADVAKICSAGYDHSVPGEQSVFGQRLIYPTIEIHHEFRDALLG